jgi:hypothetical protein
MRYLSAKKLQILLLLPQGATARQAVHCLYHQDFESQAPIATMLVEIAEYTNIRPFFHGECPLISFTCNSSNFRM